MFINVARTLPLSSANGPGDRYVIWVQGCPLECPGCWNQDTWSFEKKSQRAVSDIAAEIISTPGIEGVTFTGGEPFAQATSLSLLAGIIKGAGLSLFIFTGYELNELIKPEHKRLLLHADVVITGRYVESLRCSDLPWRGSSNQEVHFLSGRYGPDSMANSPAIEFHLSHDSSSITGFPVDEEWRRPL